MIDCFTRGLFDYKFTNNDDFIKKCLEHEFNYCPYCGELLTQHISYFTFETYKDLSILDDSRLCVHGNNKDLCICSKYKN